MYRVLYHLPFDQIALFSCRFFLGYRRVDGGDEGIKALLEEVDLAYFVYSSFIHDSFRFFIFCTNKMHMTNVIITKTAATTIVIGRLPSSIYSLSVAMLVLLVESTRVEIFVAVVVLWP